MLYDPAEHRPLAGPPWSEAAARDAIAEIATDAVSAYQGPARLWPNHPADLNDESEDRPYRNVYLGAAGVAWALQRLATAGFADALPGLAELAASLHAAYLADAELTELETGTPPPPPSLLFGESGVLLALEAFAGPDAARHDALRDCVTRNAHNPTRELCWGSPGTLLAAAAMWRATGEAEWAVRWREGAQWLIDEWQDPVWVQDMYGEIRRFVGAGHGFAGNAMALLAGRDLLGEDTAVAVAERVADVAARLAVHDGDRAQWPAYADVATGRRPVQWCHGAPGIVGSLAGLPARPDIDQLLVAGGELTWQAGPLRKGVGLCHGTAGNAYALLALHARTGDECWLERARAFAADAATDVRAWRARHERGRYSLYTGDVGVALLLAACLDPGGADGRLPFLGDALSPR